MTVFARFRTPLRPQFQTTECGVAVLRIMFAHFGFEPSTAEIRRASGVSRDCVSAADIRRTARAFGFECKAVAVEPAALRAMTLPVIVHLNFIHFVVLEAFKGESVRLNCPAAGRIAVGLHEFDADFTGVALTISPTDRSPRAARESKAETAWWRWVAQSVMGLNLARALRSGMVTQLKALPLDVLTYRLPEVLYGLAASAHDITGRVYDLLAPATLGLVCVLAVLGWLATVLPSAAGAFAAVFALWLAWVWAWSIWRGPTERRRTSDDSLTDLVFSALGRPQSANLADGPDRTWRVMRGRRAQAQLVDIQVRLARVLLAFAPALLVVVLLSAACLVPATALNGHGLLLIVSAAAIAGFSAPLTRLRGLASPLRRDGFQWRDFLEEPIPETVDAPPPPTGVVAALEDVAFTFSLSKPAVFSGIDLQIAPGEQIGLVGPSGCGKSTVTKLIMGVYAPTSGAVSVNRRAGSPARVDRHATLFEGTVRDNLTLWDPRISERDLDAAVEDAGLGPVLACRPGGLDAPVKSFGGNFSGGQLQRLEIARALARNPSLLILDDAIDALDFDSETAIRAAIRRRGCALLLASHRANSIAACDRVYTLKAERAEGGAPPDGVPAGAGPALLSGDPVVRAEEGVGAQWGALHDALDRLAPAVPDPALHDLSPSTMGEALARQAAARGHRLQRLRFTEPSWWRLDFGKALAFTPDGDAKPLFAAWMRRAERRAAASAYREDAYTLAPVWAGRLSNIADWRRGALAQGAPDAVRAVATTVVCVAIPLVIVAGLRQPLTPARSAALVVLAVCEGAVLLFQAVAIQRFESAVRRWDVDGFTALLTRLNGDVLVRLSHSVVYRGLDVLERLSGRLVEAVGKVAPAAFALAASLGALAIRGGVAALEVGALGAAGLLLIQLAGCLASKGLAGQEPEAALAARRHLGVTIWGLTKLRLLGVADQALARWVAMDDCWRGLRNRKRVIDALVAASQGLATLLTVGWLTVGGRGMPDRALLCGIGWVAARAAAVLGAGLKGLIEDRRSRADVRALLAEAPASGSMKTDAARAPICVRKVTVCYAGCRDPALRDVSVEIDPRELTVLAGPSGCGKSTLLRVILGLQRVQQGAVCVGGNSMQEIDLAHWRRRIAGVFQGDRLGETVTVRGHLCMGAEYALHDVWAALEAVELAAEVRAMPMGLQSIVEAGSFSTGQQQRLLIAAALLQQPALMILDEATNAIPDTIQARIVQRLRRRGVGCVVVTHRQTLIALADRVHVLDAGRVVYSGAPSDEASRLAAFTAHAGAFR